MELNEFAVTGLEMARWMTLAGVEGLTEAEMTYQPKEGMNHPLWLLGHIAVSENGLILRLCSGKDLLSGDWQGKFGIKSVPVADAKAYPKKEEVLAALAKTHEAAIEYVRSLAASDLDKRPMNLGEMPPSAQARFSTIARCIAGHVAHEASHVGQMAVLRRLMGKQPRV